MSNAYLYSGAPWAHENGDQGLFADSRNVILPKLRVHSRVLRELRNIIASFWDGDVLGSLSARQLEGVQPHMPDTLFADSLVPTKSARLRLDSGRMYIPIIKCQALGISDAIRTGELKWKRLNSHSAKRQYVTTALTMLGGVALCSEINGTISLVVTVDIPCFSLLRTSRIVNEKLGPLLSEVSLSIALNGGTSMNEGEYIGYLCKHEGDHIGRIVEPIHMNIESERREIVGMWALGGEDKVWLAAAVYALEVAKKRNRRIAPFDPKRRVAHRQLRDREQTQEASFLLAQFSAERGGPPRMFECQLRIDLSNTKETFFANMSYDLESVTASSGNDTMAADFVSANSFLTSANVSPVNQQSMKEHVHENPENSLDIPKQAQLSQINEEANVLHRPLKRGSEAVMQDPQVLHTTKNEHEQQGGPEIPLAHERDGRRSEPLSSRHDTIGERQNRPSKELHVENGEESVGTPNETNRVAGDLTSVDDLARKYLGYSFAEALELYKGRS